MPTSDGRANPRLRGTLTALLLLCALVLLACTTALASAPTEINSAPKIENSTSNIAATTPVTGVRDAFLEFVPQAGGPPNVGSIQVGQRFALDLMLNAGSNDVPNGVTSQQSYLTFTHQ